MFLIAFLLLVGCNPATPPPTPIGSLTMAITNSPASYTSTDVSGPPETIVPPSASTTQTSNEESFALSEKRQSNLVFKPNYKIMPAVSPDFTQVANSEYGFTFQYPADLELLTSANSVTINWGEQSLHISFRKPDEYPLGRTGVPEGDIFEQGEVNFVGTEIPRRVLISNSLDMAVLYNGGGEFEVDRMVGGLRTGKLVFGINLDTTAPYFQQGFVYNGIPDDVQAVADQIVASFLFFGPLP
ncbi:MAG TPA: hypothetical protein VN364_12245 [Bellilinea sp.]|nr:hypothetical protein [Bellilinea sp.]